jgi:hypothetical protein
MTLTEMRAEHEYRKAERLAILTDGGKVPVTQAMVDIAESEADAWLKSWEDVSREQGKLL